MAEGLKTCTHCNNFYKVDSPQFLINLVITERLSRTKNKDILKGIQQEVDEVSEIKWCICKDSIEEKKKYIKDFERDLIDEKVDNKIGLGLDFGLNKNIIYYKDKDGKSFDKITFLSFIKGIKNHIMNHNLGFDFDFIDCSKLEEMDKNEIRRLKTETKFIMFYGLSYYISNGHMFKQLNEIVVDRLVNGKKNFILCDSHATLGQLFKEIQEGMYKNQKHVIEESKEIFNASNGFNSRIIKTTINKKGESVVLTNSPKEAKEAAVKGNETKTTTKQPIKKGDLEV